MTSLEDFLIQYKESDLLKIATAGSVDDGKSTLIGRLLYESTAIFEDQLKGVRDFSVKHRNQEIDFSLVTDGLKAEREQGITIDVAYRYFSTPKRRFIIADTPGHEQYTRNMATGASTATLALILIDVLKGVTTQTKRHTFISSLLGIRHFIVAVNKMDLVDYSEKKFHDCVDVYRDFSDKLPIESIQFIPISALKGDNIAKRSESMEWYRGYSLLDYLEEVNVSGGRNLIDFRFPVQYVNWSGTGQRAYCGSLASGIIRVGEKIVVLPSGTSSIIKQIISLDENVTYAFAPQAVTIYLVNDIDISRGDMFVREKNIPNITQNIEANLVWMDIIPMIKEKIYLIKHLTNIVKCSVSEVKYRFDPEDLHRKPANTLKLNEIGKVKLHLLNPIYTDIYEHNRQTGCFIIIDPTSYLTVGAGMITKCDPTEISGYHVKPRDISGITTWYQIQKDEIEAKNYYAKLKSQSETCIFIDDDVLYNGLNSDIKKNKTNNKEHIRRLANICKIANSSGVNVVVASHSSADLDAIQIIGNNNLIIM